MLAAALLFLIVVPSKFSSAGATRPRSNVCYGLENHAAFIAGVASASHVQQAASASRWLSQGGHTRSRSLQSDSAPIACCARLTRRQWGHLSDFSKISGWHFTKHNSRCDLGSATAFIINSRRPMMRLDIDGDDVAPPPSKFELDGANPSAGAWAGNGGSGNGGNGNDDPGVQSLVDLIELLHASENPLWDLIRFEVSHRNILAWAGTIPRIVSCEVPGVVCVWTSRRSILSWGISTYCTRADGGNSCLLWGWRAGTRSIICPASSPVSECCCCCCAVSTAATYSSINSTSTFLAFY